MNELSPSCNSSERSNSQYNSSLKSQDSGESCQKKVSVQIPPSRLTIDDDSTSAYPSISPKHEMARVHTLHASMLLNDKTIEKDLLIYTSMAARMFKVPLATINLIDSQYVHFISVFGKKDHLEKIERIKSLCSYAISDDAPTVTVFNDPQEIAELPVFQPMNGRTIQFYASTPILFLGYKIGSLCIMDYEIRHDFDDRKRFIMLDLTAIVSRYLEERQRQSLLLEINYAQLMVSILQSLKPSLKRVMRQKRTMEYIFDIIKQQRQQALLNKTTGNKTINEYIIELLDAINDFQSGLNQLSTTVETSLSLGMMSIQLKPSAIRKRSLSFNPHNTMENGLIKWINELFDLHIPPLHYSSLIHDVHWSVRPTAARCLHVTDVSTEAFSLIVNLLISRNLVSYKTIYIIADMNHLNTPIEQSDIFSNIRSSRLRVHIVCCDPIKIVPLGCESVSYDSIDDDGNKYQILSHHNHNTTSMKQLTTNNNETTTLQFIQQCDLFVIRNLLHGQHGDIEHYVKHTSTMSEDDDNGHDDHDHDHNPYSKPSIDSEWFSVWLPCKSICANNPVITPLTIHHTTAGSAISSTTAMLQSRSSSSRLLQNIVDIEGLLTDRNWEQQHPPTTLTSLVSTVGVTCKKSNLLTKMSFNEQLPIENNKHSMPSSSNKLKISLSMPLTPKKLFPFPIGSPFKSNTNRKEDITQDSQKSHSLPSIIQSKAISTSDIHGKVDEIPQFQSHDTSTGDTSHHSMLQTAWKHFTDSIFHPPWHNARISPN